MIRKLLVVLALAPAVAPAAAFSVAAVLRAGNPAPGQDELFLGPTSANPAVGANVSPAWLDGVDHAFTLLYNASTNTATLSADYLGLSTSTVSWNPPGVVPSTAVRTWTVAAGGMAVRAEDNTRRDTAVALTSLSISGAGFTTINLLSITAAQTGAGTVTASNIAPISFSTPNGSGNWMFSGNIRFTGIGVGAGASRDDLRAVFNIGAVDGAAAVPEPASLLLSALGLAALGVLHRARARSANGH